MINLTRVRCGAVVLSPVASLAVASTPSSCPTWVTADNQLTGNVDSGRSAVILTGETLGSFTFAPAPFSTPYTATLSVQD